MGPQELGDGDGVMEQEGFTPGSRKSQPRGAKQGRGTDGFTRECSWGVQPLLWAALPAKELLVSKVSLASPYPDDTVSPICSTLIP